MTAKFTYLVPCAECSKKVPLEDMLIESTSGKVTGNIECTCGFKGRYSAYIKIHSRWVSGTKKNGEKITSRQLSRPGW